MSYRYQTYILVRVYHQKKIWGKLTFCLKCKPLFEIRYLLNNSSKKLFNSEAFKEHEQEIINDTLNKIYNLTDSNSGLLLNTSCAINIYNIYLGIELFFARTYINK